MNKADKNKNISKSIRTTKEKRQHQICSVFEVKLDESHFNKNTMNNIDRMFLEAKWYKNHVLAQDGTQYVSDKLKEVQIKFKNQFENRQIKILSSQMKQSIIGQIKNDIIGLSKKKKNGKKNGRLKFKSKCNSINLVQFGKTFKIKDNKIKIQNIKQWIRVNGLNQIDGYEVANAKFIKKPSGYYLHITCYIDKEKANEIQKKKEYKLGIIKKQQGAGDFGILNQITFSNGIEVKYQVDVASNKIRKLHKISNRKQNNSKNKYKSNNKLRKKYEKTNNQKKDISNKVLNIIKTEYDLFGYQNDNLNGWQRIWGRRMLNTAIGGIMTGLKKSTTSVEVDRFAPTTKECPICHHKQNITLAERIFKCDKCDYTRHRDLKSAEDILNRSIELVGAERIEFTPAEMKTSTHRIFERLNAIPRVRASFVEEAESPKYQGGSHSLLQHKTHDKNNF